MVQVIFYEKPGCPANAKQKKQLEAAGHSLEVRDLTAEAWTPVRLAPFFGERPVEDWFNRTHPDVRSGKVDRNSLSAPEALALLAADPELIRRPLLQVGEDRAFGFDPVSLGAWIGLTPLGEGSCDEKHAQGRCDHGHM